MAEHDVTSMSTRDLKQAVLERDQALNEKGEIQNALTTNQGTVIEITSERDELSKNFL